MTDVADLVRRARALVFDFDGTLVDSGPIKRRAFEACFSEFPDHREEILTYCLGHHAVPRGDKFSHVYERILRLPYTEAIAVSLSERFRALTTEQIAAAPEIPCALRFLRSVRRACLTALLSTTPHETLLEILGRRGWADLFTTIRGAPVVKGAWLRTWRKSHGFEADAVVFFGDTEEDAAAAATGGCAFVAVADPGPGGLAQFWIPDFTPLVEAL
jgi:phosphoglycolate phosphatase-like HAD superfamily hydrolase